MESGLASAKTGAPKLVDIHGRYLAYYWLGFFLGIAHLIGTFLILIDFYCSDETWVSVAYLPAAFAQYYWHYGQSYEHMNTPIGGIYELFISFVAGGFLAVSLGQLVFFKKHWSLSTWLVLVILWVAWIPTPGDWSFFIPF